MLWNDYNPNMEGFLAVVAEILIFKKNFDLKLLSESDLILDP